MFTSKKHTGVNQYFSTDNGGENRGRDHLIDDVDGVIPEKNKSRPNIFEQLENKRRQYLEMRKRKREEKNQKIEQFQEDNNIVTSLLWPPDGTKNLEEERKSLTESIDQNRSHILTKLYEKMLSEFRKKYGDEKLAVQLAGEFMRQKGMYLQASLAKYPDPLVFKREVSQMAKSYVKNIESQNMSSGISRSINTGTEEIIPQIPQGIDEHMPDQGVSIHGSEALSNPIDLLEAPNTKGDEDFFSEEEGAIFEEYSKIRDTAEKFHETYGFHPDESALDHEDPPKALIELTEEERKNIENENIVEYPLHGLSSLQTGESKNIPMFDEGGISEVECTHLENGDYILSFPDGTQIMLDLVGSVEQKKVQLEREMRFLTILLQTPIIRRMLSSGYGNFSMFQDKLENTYGKKFDEDNNVNELIRILLEMTVKKISSPTETWGTLEEKLKSKADISSLQVFLREHRNELLADLRDSHIAKKQNGNINPWDLIG